VSADEITAHVADGRVISVPLAWSRRLSEATPAQRAKIRIIGSGQGIHWPDVDEEISVEGMLYGSPAPYPKATAQSSTKRGNREVIPSSVAARRRYPWC